MNPSAYFIIKIARKKDRAKKIKVMKKVFYLAAIAIWVSFSANAQSWFTGSRSTTNYSAGRKTSVISCTTLPSYNTNPEVRYQSGYVRSNGTYIQPHFKTNSNSSNWDNFSTRSNVNPFSGKVGTVARDYSSGAYNYGVGKTIYTGTRGGQFYYNGSGNKTYIPKRR